MAFQIESENDHRIFISITSLSQDTSIETAEKTLVDFGVEFQGEEWESPYGYFRSASFEGHLVTVMYDSLGGWYLTLPIHDRQFAEKLESMTM